VGHRYLVTKQIPHFAVRVFGRVVTILQGVSLAEVHDPNCPECEKLTPNGKADTS
jgi:hypothetical protein